MIPGLPVIRQGVRNAKGYSMSQAQDTSFLAGLKARLGFSLYLLKQRKSPLVGLAIITIIILVAILAPFIAPYDPDLYSRTRVVPPSWEHWFGIDHLGRDVLSRVIYGARISLIIGVLSVLIALGIGVFLGVVAGYFGGIIDTVIMRSMDVMMALPYVLMAILIAAVLGPSLENAILSIGIVRVPRFARLTRACTITTKKLQYIEAARALGASSCWIITRDILPNIFGPIIVYATLSLGDSILGAAVLSFLGLGAQPPIPEWGAMLNEAQRYITRAPYLSIFPGMAIFLTVLGFNLFGDGLRDILDPKSRQ